MTGFEARVLTGPAMLVIGSLFLWVAYRLWAVSPINRVFRLGPYVTEEGIKAVVRLRLYFLALGLFLTMQGMSNITFWFIAGRNIQSFAVQFQGSLAAGFAVFAAVKTVVVMLRLWRAR